MPEAVLGWLPSGGPDPFSEQWCADFYGGHSEDVLASPESWPWRYDAEAQAPAPIPEAAGLPEPDVANYTKLQVRVYWKRLSRNVDDQASATNAILAAAIVQPNS